MTLNNIIEFFKDDSDLLKYFDPFSDAKNNTEAATEVYFKLVDYSSKERCYFERCHISGNEIGYIFYSKSGRWFRRNKKLISFCVKQEFRNSEMLSLFGRFIKKRVGRHFMCFLYSRNTRAINFLERIGMKKKIETNLITYLYI